MHASHLRVDPIRVVVADARGPRRLRCRQALSGDEGFAVVAEAVNAAQLIAVAAFEAPDVVVLDASLPNEHGVDVVAELAARAPRSAVLVDLVADEASEGLRSAVRRVAVRNASPSG